MSSIMCLTTMDYLTDEMNTMCILLYMVCLDKTMISGHSSIHGHHNDKGINNSMINLTYYSVLYILSEWKKGLCIRLSVYQELHGYKSVTKLHRNVCKQFFKKSKWAFTDT